MNQDKRLDKVQATLTPKQAFVVWLQEAQKFKDIYEFLGYLRELPELSRPANRLSHQVEDVIRKEMRGKRPEVIDQAVRRATRDLVFLFDLRLQVNGNAMSKEHGWDLMRMLLAERLSAMVKEKIHLGALEDAAFQVDLCTPYPLDPETDAAVEAAVRNHVTTWEYLEEGATLHDWLFVHLVEKGATRLSGDMYQCKDGKCLPNIMETNEKEVRDCFKSEKAFELFRSGKDFTNGLADVTDAEYNRHYDRLVSGTRKLVDSKKMKAGAMVWLETVPVPHLRGAPLVQGGWLDRFVVELAEWGALIQARGYRFEEAVERNALAPVPVVDGEGKQVDRAEVEAVRKQSVAHLKKYPGKTKTIDGRPHLRFEEYSAWRGRKVKGSLSLQQGFLTASWNALNEDEATVGGIVLEELDTGLEWPRWMPAELDEEKRRRQHLVDDLRRWSKKDGKQAEMVDDWRLAATGFLGELLAYREAVTQIEKRYVESIPLLFPDVARDLGQVIEGTETLVGMFNDLLAKQGVSAPIDLVAVGKSALKQAAVQMTYLADMAKAEALEEMGEREASMELAGKYL